MDADRSSLQGAESVSDLAMVDSAMLERTANVIGNAPRELPGLGVAVSAEQMHTAARLLREAEPSKITSPRRLASTRERPGWISRDHQEGGNVLVFEVGILPCTKYRIDRSGEVLSS